MQDKIDKNFISFFADVSDERLRFDGITCFVCCQPILREGIIEIIDDYHKIQMHKQARVYLKYRYCQQPTAVQISWLDLIHRRIQ